MEKLQPKLRFPEFRGDWVVNLLGDIAKFSKGKGLSKSDIVEEGLNECIRYGELYTHYSETIKKIKSRTNLPISESVLSEENDIIIPASGETQIDIATASCVLKGGVILGGDLNIIKTNNNGVFMSYYLNNTRKEAIASLSQGISVVHLYSSQLATLKINLPKIIEQTKIATFLSAIDEKLNLLKEKKATLEEYKNGMMQKIFSQEIRFKDDNEKDFADWKEKTITDICSKIQSGGTPKSTNKNYYDGEIPFLSISDMTKQGKYLTHTSNKISEEGLKNSSSWLVPENSLIYSMYASVGFVAINKIPLATSQAVLNLILKDTVIVDYVYYYLVDFQKNLAEYITTGTQGNLNAQSVKSFRIPIPCLTEQTKIAKYLSSIDEKTELVSQQIEDTQEYKNGLLQQMFV